MYPNPSLYCVGSRTTKRLENVRYLTGNYPTDTPKMSVARDRLTVLNRKKEGSKMLNLSYTVEKDGSLVSVSDRLMLSESMINDLMDTLVSNGFDVVEMSVSPATL